MPVPTIYRKSGEALTNYDFTDIASGTGYQEFLGVDSRDNTTGDFHLTDFTINPEKGISELASATDYDFDTSTFNLPRTIDGDVIISFPWTLWKNGGATAKYNAYITVQLKKYDGTTATNLGSSARTISIATPSSSSVAEISRHSTLKINLDKQIIKKGELLRVTITPTIALESGSATAAHVYIGHNPQNNKVSSRVTTTGGSTTMQAGDDDTAAATGDNGGILYGTQFQVLLPFKLDL